MHGHDALLLEPAGVWCVKAGAPTIPLLPKCMWGVNSTSFSGTGTSDQAWRWRCWQEDARPLARMVWKGQHQDMPMLSLCKINLRFASCLLLAPD